MKPLLRAEDARLITGQGRFVNNIAPADTLYGVFVRATQANAMFTVNARPAEEMAGVLRAFVAESMPELVMPSPNPLLVPLSGLTSTPLSRARTRYVGEPLALVVATSLRVAKTAAEAVQVSYASRCAAVDATEFQVKHKHGTPLEVQAGDFSVTITHSQPRVQAMSMEPRASLAFWDELSHALTFWTGTQAVARARDQLAEVLRLDPSQVRVIAPDVGGAFGAKASLYPEDFALAYAAKAMRARINWTAERSEEFLSATQGRGAEITGSLRLAADGEFVALDARFEFPLGAWLPYSAAVPLRNAARILPGPYHVRSIDIEGSAHFTSEAATNIYRGAGRPEAALLMERLVEQAARAVRIDPVALRRRNMISREQMPYRSPTGETLDAGDFPRALTAACDAFGYEQARTIQARRRNAGELVGIGIACYIEPCGAGWESARVTLFADGRVEVASGSSAQGQGHETTFAEIAAEALSIDRANISVVHGDTALAPDGIGALASRSIAIGGSAVLEAARRAKALAAEGASYPIVTNVKYTAPLEAWSYGTVIAQMSIDTDTGVPTIERIVWADDAGRIISPVLAKGQLLGGLAQGLGQAMMEAIRYDASGQLKTGSLMDYAIARASDMPQIEIVSLSEPTTANALGAKGVGEAGCIGVPAALLNAACDALSEFDTTSLSFPLTSETLWRVLQTKKVAMQ